MPANATEEQIRDSQIQARTSMEQGVKDYLNPHDRFAQRMKRSMTNEKPGEGNAIDDQ